MEGRRLDDFLEGLQRHDPAGLNAVVPTFFQVARQRYRSRAFRSFLGGSIETFCKDEHFRQHGQ